MTLIIDYGKGYKITKYSVENVEVMCGKKYNELFYVYDNVEGTQYEHLPLADIKGFEVLEK